MTNIRLKMTKKSLLIIKEKFLEKKKKLRENERFLCQNI